MQFSNNAPILFLIVAAIILVVLSQSAYFLIRAVKRAKEKGMDMSVIKKTVTSAAIFTVAPAIAILVGVVSLSKSLGIPLPWLRLSVIGSQSYETVSANAALTELGLDMNTPITDPSAYVTVTWVMTVGIILGLVLVPLFTKKIQGGLKKLENRDKKWSEIFQNAMFLGMISAFLGYVFCDVSGAFSGDLTGLIPVLVMLVSCVIMAVCGLFATKLKQKWLTDYALPFSLIGGMAAAIPITAWLG